MSAAQPAQDLTPALVREAQARAGADDCAMPEAIARVAGWSDVDTLGALARAFDHVSLDAGALAIVGPRFDLLSYAECERHAVAVIRDADGNPALVLTDPFDAATASWARRRSGLVRVPHQTFIASLANLRAFLQRQQGQVRMLVDAGGEVVDNARGEVAADITLAAIEMESSPVVRLVDSALHDAWRMGASDIHLECDASSLRVLYRVDGVLVPITQAAGRDVAEQAISRIKVMAELDIAETRVPQDGRIKVRIDGRELDLRVSVMPSIFGEDAVLRLLDRQALAEQSRALRLDDLGLDAGAMLAIRRLSRMSHGMVLVTGPTGSGKTTTLYAAITEIQTGRDKIITIEDPVEYRLPRVLQIPVNEKKGLTFARGLRSILRHDPDKIMVGEIRDDETAQIAVQAALTGHLMFTTVHANSAFDVLGRFLHMGVDAYSLAAALNGIVAQRLLRLNCPACSTATRPSDDELAMAGLDRAEVADWQFKVGKGCASCRDTGFKGRLAVAEVLCVDDAMRELIAGKAAWSALKEAAARAGLTPLRQTALACVARGATTLDEVLRVAS